MSFNTDPSKQAQQVIFSQKSKKLTQPPLVFNNNNVSQSFPRKYLGVILDFKLTFEDHLNNLLAKVNKAVGLLRRLRNLLPRTTLITISKAFIQTMVMSCTFKPLITRLMKNWNLFNMTNIQL